MLRYAFALLLFLGGSTFSCYAQFYPTQYRPPNQNWQFLQTPHFKLIYAQGNDSTALQMGRILEQQYAPVQELVGGGLENFPVILNDYNDLSNGFVTSLHFRSEIELPPIKGKSQNPQNGSWLENVGPHELVHALQFSNLGEANIPRLVNLFSPDLARSFHGAIPAGLLEGIAVHHESENVTSSGGRGNYPFFTNQFNAVFNSDDRWSMGQHAHISTDTRPFNRHYIGGYEFTAWLQDEYGIGTTRETLDFYMDYPFLGYGVALHHTTGQWPNELYDRFENDKEQSITENSANIQATELSISLDGRSIRRPKWLSDSTLIFYGSFYNARSGFYSYDLTTNKLDRIVTTNSVSDYQYDLSADRSKMIYSYYESDAIYDNTYKAELVQYDFSTRKKKQLTDDDRLYAPVFSGDSLLALHSKPVSSELVSFTKSATTDIRPETVLSLGNHEIVAVAPNPRNNKLAVVANKRGIQALWIANRNNLSKELRQSPDISFANGSIFDPVWHPQQQKLMFSSDFSGTHQVYEFDLEARVIQRITGSAFNAFEASYSPDGEQIAFVKQVKNERLPFIMDAAGRVGTNIDSERWMPSKEKQEFMQPPIVSDTANINPQNWETGQYSSGLGWLKPRTILPVFEEVSNRNVYQMGLGLHSNNLLGSQTYSAEFSYLQNRLWYNLTYQNKSFFPGFRTRIFSRPSYVPIQSLGTLLRQERSLALSIPTQFRLNENIYFTSLYIEPEIRQSQIRFFELGTGRAPSDFTNITIGNIFAQFNYRLQQNSRDLQPNSGLVLFSELEHYLTSDELIFSAYQNNIRFTPDKLTALQGGLFGYVAPLRRWNQSLRVGVRGITQSGLVFDSQGLVSDGFSEPILLGSNNLMSLSTRYTIPLAYIDDGGLLLPLYLSNIYLVAFSNTVTDPTFSKWKTGSRSVFGLELRAQFRLSNLSLDFGIGFGYEPTRNNTNFYIGNF
jgi:hypothetical protein